MKPRRGAAANRKDTIMARQTTPTVSKPTHRLYRVEGDGKSARWTEIGAAWPNKDGQGFSISCTVVPLGGRIIMRAITERPASKNEAA
jgi:hypothetical protein